MLRVLFKFSQRSTNPSTTLLRRQVTSLQFTNMTTAQALPQRGIFQNQRKYK